MRTELMEQFRQCLSTEGNTGFLIAADAFDESAIEENRLFGELLRLYVDIQTSVRMSAPIPVDKADRFAALNKMFEGQNGYVGYATRYSMPMGPFFLKLDADFNELNNDLNLLEAQPVRTLSITSVQVDNKLAVILRNHRMDYMNELTLSFQYNKRHQESEIAKMLSELKSACLMRVTLSNVTNRLNIIPALFAGAAKVPSGCELIIGTRRVAVKA